MLFKHGCYRGAQPLVFIGVLVVLLFTGVWARQSEQDKRPNAAQSIESRASLNLTPEEQNWLQAHQKIRVAGPKAFPPFHFYEENGLAKGIAADYVRLLADMIVVELQPAGNLLWSQVIDKTQKREIDLIACAGSSAERGKYLSFTQPFLSFPLVIFTRKDAPFISGLKDLHGKKVACIRKVMTSEWLKRDKIKIIPQFYNTPLEALQSVSVGDADAHIGNLAANSYLIDKYGLFNLKVAAPTPYGNYELYMAVRSDWPELVSILNKAMDAVTPETHVAIRNKWLSVRYEHGLRPLDILKWVLIAVACVLPVIIVVLIWNRRLNREIHKRKQIEKGNEKLIVELKDALARVKTLSGLLPICANCKKIRDDQGYWNQIESYLSSHSGAKFTHGICPECARELYPHIKAGQKKASADMPVADESFGQNSNGAE